MLKVVISLGRICVKNNSLCLILVLDLFLDRTSQQQLVSLSALCYCLCVLILGVGILSVSSSNSSSVILVSKSSIWYFIDSAFFNFPFFIIISLAKSEWVAARDFLPLLFG